MEDRIELDGKYTIISNRGVMRALRYGREWRDLSGDKLVFAMFMEIEKLQRLDKVKSEALQTFEEVGMEDGLLTNKKFADALLKAKNDDVQVKLDYK